jgi:D-glycero-D-manno-heptose 1,7-bisphosphate phosphatase
MNKAIFIDKDGTLIPDIPYNVNPDMITLQANIVKGLRLLQDEGYRLFIISNQAGVAHGHFSENRLIAVRQKIESLLAANNLVLSGFYYCPHHPDGTVKEYATDCHCRKPMPGMILQAAKEHNINLSESWMIGDILNDVEAGARAGCRTVLINNGNESEWKTGPYRNPTITCNNIDKAAFYIYDKHFSI